MKKINFLVMLLFLATLSAQAQVTIGDVKNPESFSILELISDRNDNGYRGLRLPQLTTEEREAMEETNDFQNEKNDNAVGLQIFNTTTRCVETWNGSGWIQSCGEDGPRPATGKVAYLDGTDIKYREFMSYNLGATEMSIKDQLQHDVTIGGTFLENTTPITDVQKAAYTKVYGSKYQGGRKSDGHENVWSANTTTTTGVSESLLNTATGQVDPDEDADKDYYGRFILGGSGSKNDWITENTLSANHYGTDDAPPYYHMYPGRWDGRGNKSYTEPTDPFPSSKVKVTNGNDPCPAGFRVPSQVEWAVILSGGSWSGGVYAGINKWVWVSGTQASPQTLDEATYGTALKDVVATTSGYLIYPAVDNTTPYNYYETPTLFLPAAGIRNNSNGSLSNGGSYGNYWSSTAYSNVNNANNYNLYFNSGNGGATYTGGRAYGFSVRCVAD